MGGDSKVRLRSGKKGSETPMEIFFVDMIQFDPISESTRKVKRVGEKWSWRTQARRSVMEVFRAWYTGKPWRESFDAYKVRRHCILEGDVPQRNMEASSEWQLYHEQGFCASM